MNRILVFNFLTKRSLDSVAFWSLVVWKFKILVLELSTFIRLESFVFIRLSGSTIIKKNYLTYSKKISIDKFNSLLHTRIYLDYIHEHSQVSAVSISLWTNIHDNQLIYLIRCVHKIVHTCRVYHFHNLAFQVLHLNIRNFMVIWKKIHHQHHCTEYVYNQLCEEEVKIYEFLKFSFQITIWSYRRSGLIKSLLSVYLWRSGFGCLIIMANRFPESPFKI